MKRPRWSKKPRILQGIWNRFVRQFLIATFPNSVNYSQTQRDHGKKCVQKNHEIVTTLIVIIEFYCWYKNVNKMFSIPWSTVCFNVLNLLRISHTWSKSVKQIVALWIQHYTVISGYWRNWPGFRLEHTRLRSTGKDSDFRPPRPEVLIPAELPMSMYLPRTPTMCSSIPILY